MPTDIPIHANEGRESRARPWLVLALLVVAMLAIIAASTAGAGLAPELTMVAAP